MISHEQFMGGAKYTLVSSNIANVLHYSSARIQWFEANTIGIGFHTINVTLPNDLNTRFLNVGGPHFIIVYDPVFAVANGLKISNSLGTLLATLTLGQVAVVSLIDNTVSGGVWQVIIYTINAAATVGTGTAAATSNPEEPGVFDPFCFVGDICDSFTVEHSGVAAPMFQDSCEATNSQREPIRAADFNVASIIPVFFREDMFSVDANHPHAASLTDEFFDALYRAGGPHYCEYQGPLDGTSSHWNHIRHVGTWPDPGGWVLNPSSSAGIDVQRHWWRATREYEVLGATYTLEVRVVVEHTVDPQPILKDTPAISVNNNFISQDEDDNAIVCNICDFLDLGFEANQIITISGFTGGGYNGRARIERVEEHKLIIADATMVDDALGESVTILTITGGGQNSTDRGAYGSLFHIYVFTDQILNGSVDPISYTPTGAAGAISFSRDDPCKWGGIIAGETEAEKFCHPQMVVCACVPTRLQAACGSAWVPPEESNREYCYRLSSGAPWNTSPGSTYDGVFRNNVFGTGSSNFSWAAMTLGGDFPTSAPLNFITIENGAGVGRTACLPTNAGWDESVGTLNLAGGSDIEASFCVVEEREMDACDGHVDEPLAGIGGSHKCFRNRLDSYCCISTILSATVRVTQMCCKTKTTYGDWNGFECEIEDVDCSCQGISTGFGLGVYDYTYVYGGNQDLRQIDYKQHAQNPDYVALHHTYAGSSTGWVQATGSFTFGATIECTAGNGAVSVAAVALYAPGGAIFGAGSIESTISNITTDRIVGIGAVAEQGTSNEFEGYYGQINRATGEVKLIHSNGATKTVLDSTTVAGLVGAASYVARFIWDGSNISFQCGLASFTTTLTADDCDYESLSPALIQVDNVTGTRWSATIADDTTDYLIVTATLGIETVEASVPESLANGYGRCDQTFNPLCGSNEDHCNCTLRVESLTSDLVGSMTDPTLNPEPPCDGELCSDRLTSPCGDCPPPFANIRLTLPTPCKDVPAANRSIICGGFTEWLWSTVACE